MAKTNDVVSLEMDNYEEHLSKIQSSVSFILGVSGLNKKFRHSFLQNEVYFTTDRNIMDTTKQFLRGGWPYRKCILYCFDVLPSDQSFNEVVEVLCRHGLYTVGPNDFILTPKLLEENPINIDAHLLLMDMLMKAVSCKLWSPTETVVASVKRFSTFSASRDLPNDTEDAVILWLNKVREKFMEVCSESSNGENLPKASLKLDDLCDSCVLSLLCHYYCPAKITIQDVVLRDDISIGDALNNLKTCLDFCFKKLFPQYDFENFECFLQPEDFLQCPEKLRTNFFTFFSLLFYCFEIDPVEGIVEPQGHTVQCTRKEKITLNEQKTASSSIKSNGSDEVNHKDLSKSEVATFIPEAKSLISEATKKSFMPRTPTKMTNLTTTNSQSDSDISSQSSHHGIPQRPLLPKRAQEDRPISRHTDSSSNSIRKSTSLHNVSNGLDMTVPIDISSKWQRTAFLSPYTARSNASPLTEYSDVFAAENPWPKNGTHSTDLLSKVDIGSDSEIEEIFSTRDSEQISSVEPTPRASQLAWGSKAPEPDPVSSRSHLLNVGDMTLETVRTAEYRSPAATTRSVTAHDDVDDVTSELTDVSTMLGSGDSALSSVVRPTEQRTSVEFSEKSPMRSLFKADSAYPGTGHDPTESSYTVKSRNFNTADSARAAGYPIITQNRNSASQNGYKHGSPENDKVSSDERHAQRLLDIIQQMRDISGRIKMQERAREADHRRMLMERGKTKAMQLRNMTSDDKHRDPVNKVKKEESSSDYSSKSPSPATSARNGSTPNLPDSCDRNHDTTHRSPQPHQASTFTRQPQRHLAASPQRVDSPGDFRSMTDDVTLVQHKLDQLQLSVERERQKRKVSELERSINDLHAELRSLEHSSSPHSAPTPAVVVEVRSPRLQRVDSLQRNRDSTDAHRHAAPSAGEPKQGVVRKSLFADVPKESGDVTGKLAVRPATTVQAGANKGAHEISVSYDSFSCQLQTGSCQSTPAKSPLGGSPTKDDSEATFQNFNETDKKAALGFVILDEKSPATKLAKKKEQFLLGRLKKEEEQRMKQMEREMEAEKRKKEAREQHEKALQKKEDEKMKRNRRLKEYQKRKEQEQEAALAIQKPGIISTTPASGSKKAVKPKSNLAEQMEVLDNIANAETASTLTNKTYGVHSQHMDADLDSVGSGSSEYSGPKLFRQLTAKSNRTLIHNALCHCCLSGKVNESLRTKTLKAIDATEARHLMILFRDSKCQYRAIYNYNPDNEKLHKITGHGPANIVPSMIESLFKYNSGRRNFTAVPSKTLSVSIDAIAIRNNLWNATSKRQ